jgi:hypothetical protein
VDGTRPVSANGEWTLIVPERLQVMYECAPKFSTLFWAMGSPYVTPQMFESQGESSGIGYRHASAAPLMKSVWCQKRTFKAIRRRRCPQSGEAFDHTGGDVQYLSAKLRLYLLHNGMLGSSQSFGSYDGETTSAPCPGRNA